MNTSRLISMNNFQYNLNWGMNLTKSWKEIQNQLFEDFQISEIGRIFAHLWDRFRLRIWIYNKECIRVWNQIQILLIL